MESAEDSDPNLMVKLEFPVQSISLSTVKPLTALSVRSGSFSTVTDDVEVIKISLTFGELYNGTRFILVDDMGKKTGVVIYKRVLRDPEKPHSPQNPFLALSEGGTVKIPVPEDTRVIKIR
ncbi:MAG: hypothetical protein PHQ42_03625 [Patescibacteria group bacterium]|nr:hypothetical protein [Patescibacteria group bacterium]